MIVSGGTEKPSHRRTCLSNSSAVSNDQCRALSLQCTRQNTLSSEHFVPRAPPSHPVRRSHNFPHRCRCVSPVDYNYNCNFLRIR